MRRDDQAWRPNLPTSPAPPRVWALTLLILIVAATAFLAYRLVA